MANQFSVDRPISTTDFFFLSSRVRKLISRSERERENERKINQYTQHHTRQKVSHLSDNLESQTIHTFILDSAAVLAAPTLCMWQHSNVNSGKIQFSSYSGHDGEVGRVGDTRREVEREREKKMKYILACCSHVALTSYI
jgi:hypothetical protein